MFNAKHSSKLNLIIIFVALFTHSNQAAACAVPAVESGWDKDELVRQTKTILYVKVTKRSKINNHQTKWTFKVLDRVKGKSNSIIEMSLPNAPVNYKEVHFNHHTDDGFWKNRYGRLPWILGLCTPRYQFEINGRYLLFVESLNNGASAERIIDENDKWLIFVKNQVGE